MNPLGPVRQAGHQLFLIGGRLQRDGFPDGHGNVQRKLVRHLDVCHFLEQAHQLRQVVEPGKTGLGTVAGSFRGQLDGRNRLAKAGGPCVKAVQPQFLQTDILQIPLEGEQLHHGVGHRGAGCKDHALAARDLIQIPAFQKQVGGFL